MLVKFGKNNKEQKVTIDNSLLEKEAERISKIKATTKKQYANGERISGFKIMNDEIKAGIRVDPRIGKKKAPRTQEHTKNQQAWRKDPLKLAAWNKNQERVNNDKRGKVRDPEIAKKIRATILRRIEVGEIIPSGTGRKWSEESISKANASRAKNKKYKWFNTKPELDVKALLEKYKLNFIHQFKLSRYMYDFYLLDHNLLIEVDGILWHGKTKLKDPVKHSKMVKIIEDIKKRDKLKNKLAKQEGYDLIRVWEDKKKETKELDKFEQYIIDNLLLKEYQLTFKPSKEVRVEELYKEIG